MGCTEHCPDAHFCANQQSRRIQVPDPWAIKQDKQLVYTIMWNYSDNSGFGLLDVAFRRREDAEDLLRILNEHGDKNFAICQSVLKS
jgi:hypothetical protein